MFRYIIGIQINSSIYPFRVQFSHNYEKLVKMLGTNFFFDHSEATVVNIRVCSLPAFFQYYNKCYNST